MKYLKYYEGRDNVDFNKIIEDFNKYLNPLGINVIQRPPGTLNIRLSGGFKFDINFMCIPYSILHISTMNFPIFNTIKYAYPYVNNETFKFIKTLEYTAEYKFKPYTEEVIYNFYYNILIDKLTNFNNSLFITTNNGSNGDINYIPFEGNNKGEKKSINCKQIILDYLNSNKGAKEVIIPQSSIDMAKFVIQSFESKGNEQHTLVHGIQQNNPLLYEKIKDKNTDDAASMHDMGFVD